jgi:hypothetical protein
MLTEDTDSEEKADALLPTVKRLRQWNAPQSARTPELIALLRTHMPHKKSLFERLLEWYPFLLLRTQARVISHEIWLASVLVMALGTIVTLTSGNERQSLNALSIVAPIVAAIGISMLYDHNAEIMLELEDTTRATARQLTLARLTLIFGFDLLLALAGSVTLALVSNLGLLRYEISLIPLIMSWLAPMTFLSGVAFLLSVLLVDVLYASVFSLSLWVAHVFFSPLVENGSILSFLSFSFFSAPEARPILVTVGGLLVALALWLVGKTEHKLGVSS